MKLARSMPAAALMLAALFPAALRADYAYISITGQRQGQIRGDVTDKGKEGTIKGVTVSHEIISPRDPATGLPTGKRQHKPLTIRMEIDRSTPPLYSALVSNENLTTVEIKFYRPNGQGISQNYFTIKLTNASIASINLAHPDPRDAILPYIEYLDVAFTYQKIEWTWIDGGITAQDDWEAPVQ
jgi:type VI secretion system secreted protein Hcp